MRLPLFDRLRASRLLAGWLLLWSFAAGIGAGVHLASHVGDAPAAATAPDDGGGSSPSAQLHADCAACRIAVTLSFALPPAAAQVGVLGASPASHFPQPRAASPIDHATRWVQGFKHGPPLLSR
jgi:hypothetical protein